DKEALAPDPTRQSRIAALGAASEGTLAEQAGSRLAERDIARQFQETGAEVTRTGAEKGARLAVETAEAEVGLRGVAAVAGIVKQGARALRTEAQALEATSARVIAPESRVSTSRFLPPPSRVPNAGGVIRSFVTPS